MAVIDRGRIVALDTPTELIRGIQSENRVRFIVSNGFDSEWLHSVPGLTRIERQGQEVVVSGSDHLTSQVAMALADCDISLTNMRIEQPRLDDVFGALTGRNIRD